MGGGLTSRATGAEEGQGTGWGGRGVGGGSTTGKQSASSTSCRIRRRVWAYQQIRNSAPNRLLFQALRKTRKHWQGRGFTRFIRSQACQFPNCPKCVLCGPASTLRMRMRISDKELLCTSDSWIMCISDSSAALKEEKIQRDAGELRDATHSAALLRDAACGLGGTRI